MAPENRSSPGPESRDRDGPRASWLLVLLVIATGAAVMGWTIYELIRAAAG